MKREFWFVVGSQFLYGPEVLKTVEGRAREIAAELSKVLPYPLVYKVTAKTNKEITDVVKEANYRDECCGIVTWCHTFSPSKMWIDGLRDLQKPWCHLATQYNQEIPLSEEGMSITFISSEIEEMLRTCSRLIVMRDRNTVGELQGEELTQERVMRTIAGGEA